MVTIVGLGYAKDDLSAAAQKAIKQAAAVVLRSARGPGRYIRASFCFDELIDGADNYDELNILLAKEVIEIETHFGDVVYCVAGSGEQDGSAARLFEICRIKPRLITAASAATPAPATFTVAASRVGDYTFDTAAALRVTEIADVFLAGDVKLKLLDYYPPDCVGEFYRGGDMLELPLEELDRQKKYDASVTLLIAPRLKKKNRFCFGDLTRLLARLTAPDGCPWDKAQTHESIRINLLEEAYEASQALKDGDVEAMTEELGDVLLQAVFHCDIASRTGEFTFNDVMTALCNKLIGRHTHIFGADRAADEGEALGYWERAKAAEKGYVSLSDQISRLPAEFAAALKAEKLFKKLNKRLGLDGKALAELTQGYVGRRHAELLFLAVAGAAAEGVHAETALSDECEEIAARYKALENDGTAEITLEELL